MANCRSDDQAQLVHELQRLADAQTKLARATDEGTRYFYQCAVAGWARSIAVLERQINDMEATSQSPLAHG